MLNIASVAITIVIEVLLSAGPSTEVESILHGVSCQHP